MAWTAPRDWSDDEDAVPDGIVTAAMLNVDVRDNLLILSTHTHTGSAGQGASSMSGLTLAALVTLTFADQSANADAAGELQRNGNDLIWYGSSAVNLTAGDATAGTASLRSLGTTSVKAAAGNHTHSVDEVGTPLMYRSGRGAANGLLWQDVNENVTTTENTLGAAQSPTFSGSNVGRIVSGFWVGGHDDETDGDHDYTLRLYINNVLKASTTITLAETTISSNYHAYSISVEYTEASSTSGQAVDLRIIRAAGTGGNGLTMGYGLTSTFVNAQ